jgi:hypothetical protein
MSIKIINRLVQVVGKQCVSCEVETELLCLIYMNFMRQSVNDDKLYSDSRIRYE